MNRKGTFGQKGEEKACLYLKQNGYTILERNFRSRTGEIDIIALKGGSIHFIEVKTRSNVDYGFPAESVTAKKQRRLMLSARYYLVCNRQYTGFKYQMDVIEVLVCDDKFYIRYINNAFEEGDK